jgi:hypothetical protein
MTPSAATLKKYGLTLEQWERCFKAQGGKCSLCTKRFTPSRLPCVDHDHRTGHVRGLLCQHCNYELGCLHDDAEWLQRAATYLRLPNFRLLLGPGNVPIVPKKNRSKP